jgi:hypothetical protein
MAADEPNGVGFRGVQAPRPGQNEIVKKRLADFAPSFAHYKRYPNSVVPTLPQTGHPQSSPIMKAEFKRTQSLFNAACELTDPEQRRAVLEAGCGEDLAFLAKMEKLLKAGDRAEEFFADCIPTPSELLVSHEGSR